MSAKKTLFLVSVAGVAFFAWGMLAHRNHVFPYTLLASAAGRVGLVTTRTEIEPSAAPLAVLKSLPYLQASFDPDGELRGVITFDRENAQPGVNFYSVFEHNTAYLMDMEGNILHEWTYRPPKGSWHHAELLPDGSVLVVVKDSGLLKLDRCSELQWSYETRAHHDVWVTDEGTIYMITREPIDEPGMHSTHKILDDRIVVLTADGVEQKEVSLLAVLRDSAYEYLLPSINAVEFPVGSELDPIHTNHVEVFDGRLAYQSPLFERSNFLISMKNLNAIAIVDGRGKKILWLWGPNNIALPHHPRLLPTGNLLVFDNGTERSRVIELDPISREVVWSYERGADFFSSWGGSVQRLPNGNTLITETEDGYVTEVTLEGKVAWRFANPDVDSRSMRKNIWRMTRYSSSDLSFLEEGGCTQLSG